MWLYEYAKRLFNARYKFFETGEIDFPERPPFPEITCRSTRFILMCQKGMQNLKTSDLKIFFQGPFLLSFIGGIKLTIQVLRRRKMFRIVLKNNTQAFFIRRCTEKVLNSISQKTHLNHSYIPNFRKISLNFLYEILVHSF